MQAVIQRVAQAAVMVDGVVVSQIERGILTLLGIAQSDSEETVRKLIDKIHTLRIFSNDHGKMAYSLRELGFAHLIVPQFTLLADCHSGRRPSFTQAAPPDKARSLYGLALDVSTQLGVPTAGGVFQASMQVSSVNDGPVTFVLQQD